MIWFPGTDSDIMGDTITVEQKRHCDAHITGILEKLHMKSNKIHKSAKIQI